MRVVWLINVILPEAAAALNLSPSLGGSWLDGQLNILRTRPDIVLTVACPAAVTQVKLAEKNGIRYAALPSEPELLQAGLRQLLQECPDILHVHGTEQPQTLMALQAYPPQRTLVSIQGLVSLCQKEFFKGMPDRFRHSSSIKRLVCRLAPIHGGLLAQGYQEMKKAAKREIKALLLAHNVAGRTAWDKAEVQAINPVLQYYHIGEILRPVFYRSLWSLDNCERHRIFISQGSYPIKGLHTVLRQLPTVLAHYPSTKLVVAGQSIYSFRNPLKQLAADYLYEYQAYCKRLIRNLGLSGHVDFTGPLNEAEMCRQYEKAHVFLLPSAIENSPNSLGEAMALGMPCISSQVGGIPDMLSNGREGLLYPVDTPDTLVRHLFTLFEDDARAEALGQAARVRALNTHDREAVTAQLLDVYRSIYAE